MHALTASSWTAEPAACAVSQHELQASAAIFEHARSAAGSPPVDDPLELLEPLEPLEPLELEPVNPLEPFDPLAPLEPLEPLLEPFTIGCSEPPGSPGEGEEHALARMRRLPRVTMPRPVKRERLVMGDHHRKSETTSARARNRHICGVS
jgi:hypothetical protein